MKLSWLGAVACSVVLVAWGERLRCQDAWVGGFSDAPGFTTSGLGVYQLHPWGTGLAVAFGTSTYSPDHYSGLARLDQHGNLQWLLADEKKLFYSPVFVPVSNGHVMYFQSSSTNLQCMNTGANLHEIDENGTVLRTKFLDLVSPDQAMELQNGDILLVSGPGLLRLKSDLTGFRWAEVFEGDHPTQGLLGYVSCVLPRDDGSLLIVGKYAVQISAGALYYRTWVASIGTDGGVLWYRTFDADPTLYSLDFRLLLPAPNGGCFLGGSVAYVSSPDELGRPFLARLAGDGQIEWQEVFCVPGSCSGGSISSGLVTPDGNLLTAGVATGYIEYPTGLVMNLDEGGQPIWARLVDKWHLPQPYLSIGFSDVFSDGGGYILPTVGGQYGEPPWVFRLDHDCNLPQGCVVTFLSPQVSVTNLSVLTPCDDRLTARSMAGYSVCDSTPSMLNKTVLTSSVICGDAYPGVVSVKKLSAPLRLKIYGWNFEDGSEVLIDGVRAPATSFKGIDGKTGQSVLMAKGGRTLAEMMPKGQAVTITVLNSDGRQSVEFPFVR